MVKYSHFWSNLLDFLFKINFKYDPSVQFTCDVQLYYSKERCIIDFLFYNTSVDTTGVPRQGDTQGTLTNATSKFHNSANYKITKCTTFKRQRRKRNICTIIFIREYFKRKLWFLLFWRVVICHWINLPIRILSSTKDLTAPIFY